MKLLCYFILFFSSTLCAQIKEKDSLNLKADLSITGFWQTGNVETIIFRAKSNFSFKPLKELTFKTINSYVYQEFGKEKADEDILSLNFLYLHQDKKIHPFLLAFISTNFRREIDLRYLLGAGVTYQIIKEKKDWLKFSVSSEYEKTVFGRANFNRVAFNGNKVINTVRATFWVSGSHSIFKNKMIVTHENYYQPSLEESDNYRWQTDVGIEFPIWKYINFKINYLHTFESIVIENQVQQDQFLTFGLKFKSY
ncbi:DUF481 domain-containing protein [Polaribacter sp. Hel_I_88]|uniref:DUF481 domain-containing protein n=1 Tax=Polaribacter sp. Hel_I_88 TaxID=1250006 RepID=UPI00047ED529|nr:DUF481 domain-containing protein [Polaribacter sp. Hel_I_88]